MPSRRWRDWRPVRPERPGPERPEAPARPERVERAELREEEDRDAAERRLWATRESCRKGSGGAGGQRTVRLRAARCQRRAGTPGSVGVRSM
ncbi:MAG TPA: hypothetical protein ENI87_10470 [bacterium]|nr:hypothetical protein [bacterium]